MKKLILSALLCAGFIQSLSAQVFQKGNMSVFAGVGASNTVANALNSVGEGASNSFGPYILGYQYHVSNKLMLGLAYSFQSASTGKQSIVTATDLVSYRTNLNVSMLMAQLNYLWLRKDNKSFVLYSGASVGTYTINGELEILSGNKDLAVKYNDLSNGVSIQLTAIGYKGRFTKTSNLGGYAELGFGMNGLFNAGINYTFN